MTKQHEIESAFYNDLRSAGPVSDEAIRDLGYDTPGTVDESIAGAPDLRDAIEKLSTPHVLPAEADANHGWPTDAEARIGRAALAKISPQLKRR